MYAVTENPTIRRLAFHPIMSTESLKAADVEAEAAGPWIALSIAAATMAVGAGFGYKITSPLYDHSSGCYLEVNDLRSCKAEA